MQLRERGNMATYTFHDLTHGTVRESSLTGIRAILVLARHDIESRIMDPISIEHEGQVLIKSDILRLTTYKQGENVKVLLPDEEAA